jgi:hypothetical protein
MGLTTILSTIIRSNLGRFVTILEMPERRFILCSTQLRRAGEHFDEVVVERVVKLALQLPGELGTVHVAGMDLKHIGMHRSRWVLEIDENLDDTVCLASRKGQ